MESEMLAAKMIGARAANFEVEGSANQYWVIRFSGVEAVSELYEFEIEVAARFVAVDELVGALATLRLTGVDGSTRTLHGLVARAEYTGEFAPRSLYRLTLVPWIWHLKHRTNSRIFQQMTTPQILEAVLSDAGMQQPYQFRLAGSYQPRDYCVQYRESDLEFIRRLMEEDGIAFYFQHEQSQHTLVMSDANTGRVEIPGESHLPFRIDDKIRDREYVRRFGWARQITPTAVAVRDFDLHATQDVEAQQARGGIQLELYDAPIGARDPAVARMQARIRLEAAQAPTTVAQGMSECPRLLPGHSFSLVEHVRDEFNGNYHVLKVVHRGEQPQVLYRDTELVYHNEFEAIPTATPYRPPRRTPRPSIRGVQTATVVGPAGEEIYVDSQARVKVQFHWDRLGKFDEGSSCWVRVSQGWSGLGYGALFIPRVGSEVLVEFIEGDPNRPVITGRIFDGTRTPPYPLPDERTKSTIRSESSPGGGGFNEIRFEDAAGAEEIYVHAQLDMNTDVLRDASRVVGRDDRLAVGNCQIEHVGVDRLATVGNVEVTQIGVNQGLIVGCNQGTHIGVDQMLLVGSSQLSEVGAFRSTVVGLEQQTTIGTNQHVTVGAVRALAVGADQFTSVGGREQTEVGGDRVAAVAGNISLMAGGGVTIAIGADGHIQIGGTQNVAIGGDSRTVVSRAVTIEAGVEVCIKAPKIILDGSDGVTLSGPGGFITIDGGGVSIEGGLVQIVNGGSELEPSSGAAPPLAPPLPLTVPPPPMPIPPGAKK